MEASFICIYRERERGGEGLGGTGRGANESREVTAPRQVADCKPSQVCPTSSEPSLKPIQPPQDLSERSQGNRPKCDRQPVKQRPNKAAFNKLIHNHHHRPSPLNFKGAEECGRKSQTTHQTASTPYCRVNVFVQTRHEHRY